MIHPFLIRERTLVDQAKDLVKAGAQKLITQVLALLAKASPAGFVTFGSEGQSCSGDVITSGTDVFLCRSTVNALDVVLKAANVAIPNRKEGFFGKVSDVRAALEKTARRINFSAIDILPWALLGTAIWLLRPSKGLLNGYPAEMARGAVYAKDCDESQRRLDMAWKALQQMEDRGDPQFIHELNKVAKVAKQLRESGCEVL